MIDASKDAMMILHIFHSLLSLVIEHFEIIRPVPWRGMPQIWWFLQPWCRRISFA